MAQNRNTHAKRQREVGKRQKAADKRARRLKRKQDPKGTAVPDGSEHFSSDQ